MIKVLVVEDSQTVRESLTHVLNSEPGIQVIRAVGNGEEALQALERDKPDLVTMDIHMPKMDGFEATRRIMETHPVPIIIVSGAGNLKDVATTFEALEAGALALVPPPRSPDHPDYKASIAELVQIVRLMSEMKVVRRWPRNRSKGIHPEILQAASPNGKPAQPEVQIVVIGASTGGPLAIQSILSGLPRNLPVPVAIVQHMTEEFVPGFAAWLDQTTGMRVQVAAAGMRLLPGNIYVAPGRYQMTFGRNLKVQLGLDGPVNGHCPSVSCCFRSAAEAFGSRAIAVLLSGMGRDGAEELLLLKERGAATIAQDKESSVVHGMPGEAIRLGAAQLVLPPARIAPAIAGLIYRKSGNNHG